MSASAGRADRRSWGVAPSGETIHTYTLALPGGVQATLTDLGATLVGLEVPDRQGALGDVVLGHDRPEPYADHATSPYFGATIGRYANRITDGRFTLDGRACVIPANDGPNALHGGPGGFDVCLWHGEARLTDAGPAVVFTRTSPDGEMGFPGTLEVRVTYTLAGQADGGAALTIDYHAVTDAPTVVNLTNHSYWNLTADPARGVLEHELTVNAPAFTPVRPGGLPTGEVRSVEGTPFDFRTPRAIGERLADADGQLAVVGGYDHNLVLDAGQDGLRLAAVLYDPHSGRELGIHTTEPGVQVYSGNFLDGTITGKGGQVYQQHAAVCLETQHYPDSPNQPGFPSTRLDPGQVFTSRTVHTFRVR
ncbi:aldose 1-epimerase [Deinococcus metalli]|uniref:Aldose 1-epimerase n=1 Tax=Deinococcus metalli TaxID=1141878 RepID=A0A7W8KG23_9DEIO|nr:aldose epimerase family protein [Deinococcus metalli]MBB5377462.1 aldose 1-epimerase [Deinococcus metalli]GHF50606.1 aldose 1-epimerase [Deinococcus metalli]